MAVPSEMISTHGAKLAESGTWENDSEKRVDGHGAKSLTLVPKDQ